MCNHAKPLVPSIQTPWKHPKITFPWICNYYFFQRREKKKYALYKLFPLFDWDSAHLKAQLVWGDGSVCYTHIRNAIFFVLYLLLHVWASSALAGKTVRTNIYIFLWCSSSRFKWFLSSRKMLKNIQKYYPTSTTFYYISKHKVVVFLPLQIMLKIFGYEHIS